jgi:hypothetical protein
MIEIRPCTLGDAHAVSSLLEELGYKMSREVAAENLRRLDATGSDPTFVACESDRPLGLIALHRCRMIQYEEPVVRITALVVDHRTRRRGIGQLLIEHALRWAEQAGCQMAELTSAVDRTDAHAFYRSLDFEPNSLRFRKLLRGAYRNWQGGSGQYRNIAAARPGGGSASRSTDMTWPPWRRVISAA